MTDSFTWQIPPKLLEDRDTAEWCRKITLFLDALSSNSDVYVLTNDTESRTFDADTVTTAELADIVATLIRDMNEKNIVGV